MLAFVIIFRFRNLLAHFWLVLLTMTCLRPTDTCAVYHARGLKNTQHIGKQDPYVEITCGDQIWQSAAHRGALKCAVQRYRAMMSNPLSS